MIVQAIALLDDLDKEINIYSMRVKVCDSPIWILNQSCRHFASGMVRLAFPGVVKNHLGQPGICEGGETHGYQVIVACLLPILTANAGFRTSAAATDFAVILPEDLEATIKAAAEISMGTEISDSDLAHIHALCDQIISISEYRAQLSEYLRNRMIAIAPNLTVLVGELVGARLISHAGSLLNLAKHPASTVQILGAEKALFRALKTKHDTPKYGLIYHASLVGQAPPKLKGKVRVFFQSRFDLPWLIYIADGAYGSN
jgi:nucleolar protein 58